MMQSGPSGRSIKVTVMNEETAETKKGRNFRGVSAEQRRAERHRKFVDAGLQLFGTHGFYNTKVRELCAEAQLTERYFYESFKSTEELFAQVFREAVESMQQHILTAIMGQSHQGSLALIRAGLEAFLKFVRQDPRVARILFIEVPQVRLEHGSLIEETMNAFDRMLTQFGNVLFPPPSDPRIRMDLIAAGLNGSNAHIVARWVYGGFQQPLEVILENCYAVFAGVADYLSGQKTASAVI